MVDLEWHPLKPPKNTMRDILARIEEVSDLLYETNSDRHDGQNDHLQQAFNWIAGAANRIEEYIDEDEPRYFEEEENTVD